MALVVMIIYPVSYTHLDVYKRQIQSIIVPDMQKKLRQGFGRAIRTETDTCVVSILDIRAVKGGKYHEEDVYKRQLLVL